MDPNPWPFLESAEAAEAMAKEVAEWPSKVSLVLGSSFSEVERCRLIPTLRPTPVRLRWH